MASMLSGVPLMSKSARYKRLDCHLSLEPPVAGWEGDCPGAVAGREGECDSAVTVVLQWLETQRIFPIFLRSETQCKSKIKYGYCHYATRFYCLLFGFSLCFFCCDALAFSFPGPARV